MREIEIIYKEGKESINNLWKYMRKPGVWALFGKKDDFYTCLNVGKSVDVGYELVYDISCLHNMDFKIDGTKQYINQFGEDCKFKSDDGLTQEYLYPYINLQEFETLMFIKIHDESDREVEKFFAWLTHSRYWRNGKKFETFRENYYDNHIKEIVKNDSYKSSWKSEREIIDYLKNI